MAAPMLVLSRAQSSRAAAEDEEEEEEALDPSLPLVEEMEQILTELEL
jgi:hypothetical protein